MHATFMALPAVKRGSGRAAGSNSGVAYLGYLIVIALVLSAVCLLQSTEVFWRGRISTLFPGKSRTHVARGADVGMLGVPWCRTKKGLQVEWTRRDLIQRLRAFVPLYEKRPVRKNGHGMQFDHSFGLWFIASWLKPDLIVESGAFKGHSTWVLRQARPSVPIISISPRHPKKYLNKGEGYVDSNCHYFADSKFLDFGKVDWDSVLRDHQIEDRSRVLVFFDDHQSELRRVKEAMAAGFQHLVFEDNYDTGTGDHYSLRQICDQAHITGGGHSCHADGDEARLRSKRKQAWDKAVDIKDLCGDGDAWWGVRGEMKDNFDHISSPISSQDHLKHSEYLESLLDVYWELPPVAGSSLTKQTRYDPARAVRPLIPDGDVASFRLLGLVSLNTSAFNGYTQMAYIHISQ